MSKKWIILIVSVAALFIGLLLYRALFWNFVENYEYAYMFDKRKGEMVELNKQGWVFSWPVIQSVHTFDTRPIQICINVSVASSTGQRVLNCKLVRFLPVGYKEFIEWHGRGSYSSSDLENYLKIYAFDQTPDPEKLYPFLKIMKVLDTGNNKKRNKIFIKMSEGKKEILLGDCLDLMKTIDDNSIDLVFTSPPYAERRKSTYGGTNENEYVDWFLPIGAEIKRILKPTGSFFLNIKPHTNKGERSLYVYDLICALKRGWEILIKILNRKLSLETKCSACG